MLADEIHLMVDPHELGDRRSPIQPALVLFT
jgi:hypothetical protein